MNVLVLGRTQFVGLEFGIFGGFGWVRSSVLVGELGFGRVRSSTSRVQSSSKFVIFGFDPTLNAIQSREGLKEVPIYFANFYSK